MSNTPAMTTARRLAGYGASSYPAGCTPAQRRRIDHKNGHARAARERGKKATSPADLVISADSVMAGDRIDAGSVVLVPPERMTAKAIMASIDAPRRASVSWAAEVTQPVSGRLSRIPVKRRKGQVVKSSGEAPLITRDRASGERGG